MMLPRFRLILVGASVVVCLPPPGHAEVIRVWKDAPGQVQNGDSWATAYLELRDAIQVAESNGEPDQIWVAAASSPYTPSGSGDTSASFELHNDIGIYGGFSGNEPQFVDRNPTDNVTVLSGDLGGLNANRVVTADLVDDSAILDGFTIRDAYQQAIVINQGSPTLTTLIVRDNGIAFFGPSGAGLTVSGLLALPAISSCQFINNAASGGGAVYCTGSSMPIFADCNYTDNKATTFPGGGAVLIDDNANPEFLGCDFNENTATNFTTGGAVFIDSLSSVSSDRVVFRDCDFIGNEATEIDAAGGAVTINNAGSGVWLTNCRFEDNIAGSVGGAIYNINPDSDPTPIVTNCTFKRNEAGFGGGALFVDGPLNLINSILVANVDLNLNSDETYGGAILHDGGRLEVVNCTISGNQTLGERRVTKAEFISVGCDRAV